MCLQFWFVFFHRKKIGTKAAHKMLVKLTKGANFINVLKAAFTCAYPKSANGTDDLTAIFALLGSGCVKAAHKMLVKLAKGGRQSMRYCRCCFDKTKFLLFCQIQNFKNFSQTTSLSFKAQPALLIRGLFLFQKIAQMQF